VKLATLARSSARIEDRAVAETDARATALSAATTPEDHGAEQQ
jgi:hypothetical protein